MANRPVYLPNPKNTYPGVDIKNIDFKWFPGLSKSQKQKSILSLHEAASKLNINLLLEISSKSECEFGVNLSAFNLMIPMRNQLNSFSVETAFQSSKVFQNGGPYLDLLQGSSQQAKKDSRLKESGDLVGFQFFNKEFGIKPRTFFYDWLYINALHKNVLLAHKVTEYQGFTDIEFNPKRSFNCQAYSVALYFSLVEYKCLNEALNSPKSFQQVLKKEYAKRDSNMAVQSSLL